MPSQQGQDDNVGICEPMAVGLNRPTSSRQESMLSYAIREECESNENLPCCPGNGDSTNEEGTHIHSLGRLNFTPNPQPIMLEYAQYTTYLIAYSFCSLISSFPCFLILSVRQSIDFTYSLNQ